MASYTKQTVPKRFKGIRIQVQDKQVYTNGLPITARYKWSTIYLYPIFFTIARTRQDSVILHEAGHGLYKIMPREYKKLWQEISSGSIFTKLNLMGVIDFTENDYITVYAKKNIKEDLSECLEEDYLDPNKKRSPAVKFKIVVAKALFNKYLGKS